MTAPFLSPAVENLRGLTFTPSAALARYRRVHFAAAGTLEYCSAAHTDCIGVLQRDVVATGIFALQPVGVEPTNNGQFCGLIMVASGTITAPAAVYADASGKVSASGTVLVGLAISSTTADGDLLTVLPSAAAILGSVARSGLTTDSQPYTSPISAFKTHATLVALGASAGTPATDMGVTPGTFGSATPIAIGEAASGNVKTDYARMLFELPAEYVSGGTITVAVTAKYSTAPTVSASVNITAYASDKAGGVSAALCASGAQSITGTAVAYSFTLTPTSRVAGDVIDILLTVVSTDTGGATGAYVIVGDVRVTLQVKG